MTDTQALQEEIQFLTDEIASLRARIGANGNAPQLHKLEMMKRLQARCQRSLSALVKRDAA